MILKDSESKKARLIAYYLPQFHPIPENNEWWGPGFTEWTNVTKAKPLFPGHHQPNLPADLGFYDLRVPETRLAQAELARTHGIEGFCYWHYWFGNGKRILERPFTEVLRGGEPDFPFCLAWANQSWTGIWHGAPNRLLMEQTYPGLKDYKAHFYAILDALRDPRYLTVDNKPLFLVYSPHELPDPCQFTDCWRELAVKEGLPGLYLLGVADPTWSPITDGFDGVTFHNPAIGVNRINKIDGATARIYWKFLRRNLRLDIDSIKKWVRGGLKIYSYSTYIGHALPPLIMPYDQYPCVVPNWDNTPRSHKRGRVLLGSSPDLFGIHLKEAINQVTDKPPGKQLVFLKSWNEWAEGNYLEPDQRFGRRYLEVVREQVITNCAKPVMNSLLAQPAESLL